MIATDTGIEAISGIGEAERRHLTEAKLQTVLELLAARPERLASIAQAKTTAVERWRAIALLLHVEAVSSDLAAVLVDAGMLTLEGLAAKPLSELQAIMEAASDEGRLVHALTQDELAEVKVDAIRLAYGGSATGRVLDGRGSPVEGARVTTGNRTTTTDAQGRFRLLGLRQLGRGGLTVQSPAGDAYVERPLIIDNVLTIAVMRVLVRPANELPVLRELDGDTFPSLAGVLYRTERIPLESIEDGDVFRVLREPEAGHDLELVSIFRALRAGVVTIHVLRIPAGQVPGEPPWAGKAFRVEGHDLVRVDPRMATRRSQSFRLALRRSGPSYPSPAQSNEELRERVAAKLRWAQDHGILRKVRGNDG